MKKIVSLMLLLAMLFTLAACGGAPADTGAKANFDVPEGGYDGSEVTIRFYSTMGSNLQTVLNT